VSNVPVIVVIAHVALAAIVAVDLAAFIVLISIILQQLIE